MNAFDVFGVPAEFGSLLLTLSLILLFSPYFPGVDFGVIKIPALKSKAKRRLKYIGPVLTIGTVSLFLPIWARFFSPPVIQNLRISQSDTDYRFEVTVKNINPRADGLINHIDLTASKMPPDCHPMATEFRISDNLVVQQSSGNQINFSTGMTENEYTEFIYKVTGTLMEACNGEYVVFSLGFDTSIPVPKDSTVQFYILLPRNLKMTENSDFSSNENIVTLLDVANDGMLENYPTLIVAVWYAGAKEPVTFRK